MWSKSLVGGSALVVAFVLLVMVPSASAAQNWLLTNDGEAPAGADFVLLLDDGTGGGSVDTTTLLANQAAIWATTESAQAVLDMSGQWTVTLTWGTVLDQPEPAQMRITIGVLTAAEEFLGAHTAVAAEGNGAATPISIAPGDFDIALGEHLAIRVANTNAVAPATLSITASTSAAPGGSTLTQPATSPNFPVPEFASVALLGSGIMLTAGLVKHRKKRL